MTGLPASMQARTNSAWVSPIEVDEDRVDLVAGDQLVAVGERPCAPPRVAATSSARARFTSVTALTVEPAIDVASLRPWSSPMPPVPMIPTRMRHGRPGRPFGPPGRARRSSPQVAKYVRVRLRSGAAASGAQGYMSCSTMQYSSRSRAPSAAITRRHRRIAERWLDHDAEAHGRREAELLVVRAPADRRVDLLEVDVRDALGVVADQRQVVARRSTPRGPVSRHRCTASGPCCRGSARSAAWVPTWLSAWVWNMRIRVPVAPRHVPAELRHARQRSSHSSSVSVGPTARRCRRGP